MTRAEERERCVVGRVDVCRLPCAPAKLPDAVRHPQPIVPVRQLPLLALATLVASAADAQIIRRPGMPFQEPTAFLSFGVGHVQGWTVHDDRAGSSSTWEFGD